MKNAVMKTVTIIWIKTYLEVDVIVNKARKKIFKEQEESEI